MPKSFLFCWVVPFLVFDLERADFSWGFFCLLSLVFLDTAFSSTQSRIYEVYRRPRVPCSLNTFPVLFKVFVFIYTTCRVVKLYSVELEVCLFHLDPEQELCKCIFTREAGDSVGHFNLEAHVLQHWEIVLNYFIDYFFIFFPSLFGTLLSRC